MGLRADLVSAHVVLVPVNALVPHLFCILKTSQQRRSWQTNCWYHSHPLGGGYHSMCWRVTHMPKYIWCAETIHQSQVWNTGLMTQMDKDREEICDGCPQAKCELSHACTYTQQPSLSLTTQQDALQPSYWYLTTLNNNNKDAFVSISLELSSGHLPSSCFIELGPWHLQKAQQWCLASQTQPSPYLPWVRTHVNNRDDTIYTSRHTTAIAAGEFPKTTINKCQI